MSKKIEIKKVTVKISQEKIVSFPFKLSESGVQVEMLDKDENYIKKAFTQFAKAQEILKKYHNQD